MHADILIARARAGDAATLSRLARRAKAHWGYPEKWLAAWDDQLRVSPDYIRTHPTFVVAIDGHIAGFGSIQCEGPLATLNHLWVLPEFMGRGIGRTLFLRCADEARRAGATRLEIESDPNAEGFYLCMGAVRIGQKPADMDGVSRFLPLFRKVLR